MKKLFVCSLMFLSVHIFAGVLPSNTNLLAGQSIFSNNGKYRLVMQTDGNVVFYRTTDNAVRFATYKYGSYLAMQSDGNLVQYSGSNQPLWYTSTNGNPGAYLNVQDDGNLVVYNTANVAKWNIGADTLPSNSPTKVGDVVGRDLNTPGLGWIGHVGIWDGGQVIEVLNRFGNAVQLNSLTSFKNASVYWGVASPSITNFNIYGCFLARCTNFYPAPYGQTEQVTARIALAKRAYQAYLIGADYTTTATYVPADAGDGYYPASRGVYRCDTFVFNVFEVFIDNLNSRFSEPLDPLWVNRLTTLGEFPILPKNIYDRLKTFN